MYTGLQKSFPSCPTRIFKVVTRKLSSTTVSNETEDVVYPPILDLSRAARVRRNKEEWHEKIKRLYSVEEKLFGINMPRYYGWKSMIVEEGRVRYNSLDHAQYITRTHVMNEHKLPAVYDTLSNEQLDSVVENVKHHIEKIVSFEYSHRLREHEITEKVDEIRKQMLQKAITKSLINQINRIMLAATSPIMPHLLEAQVDFDPRVEAFWFAGGVEPSAMVRKAKAGSKYAKNRADELLDQPVHYFGTPLLQLRHQLPLREIVPLTECTNPEFTIPEFKFYPAVIGYTFAYKHATSIPGFWPGDTHEFGLLSYHDLNQVLRSETFEEDAITVQAIFASYGWLLSQAYYQGFSTVNDITYPLVTQTILTDGQLWSFCVYQLNTTVFYTEFMDENRKRNLCWITEPMKLFEKVEDGKVHGFNEDVLKKLIKFYANQPEQRNENMTPYLGDIVQRVADIKNPRRRTWLEERFKYIMSNRPRHFQIPETPMWHKIYKIDNKTRPMDKRRDPWEFGYQPYKRRMDDHQPIYIPRCLRANPKKRKIGRWAYTFYPRA
ncbi:39S ribosomal protein S30, mitochondrial [Ceratina calcarata]|uniref:39S ribosomal protein S30, mitochondrial n=1 Tax=Ceratina calcarata TaxID=156304 RepID=A0AAJ7JE82_9HYME|nr:39S ribosomal protein S30, mitochondrial [Ceratina calcarata]